MADDLTRSDGSKLATRDDGTRHHQRVVPQSYDSGVATDASKTNPLPVRQIGESSAVANPATQPSTTRQQILAANTSRKAPALVYNNGSQAVYLGTDNTVTTANAGFVLQPGASIDWPTKTALWGITASGTADIRAIDHS